MTRSLTACRLLLLGLVLSQVQTCLAGQIGLEISAHGLDLKTDSQIWRFEQRDGRWSLGGVLAKGQLVAQPLSPEDAFWIGGGQALSYEVLSNSTTDKAIRFRFHQGSATYRVRSTDPLPVVRAELDQTNEISCAFLSPVGSSQEHGAWVTRGWVATDADGSEAFIDASNPMVFGHSTVGELDVGYAFIPEVKSHVQRNGRTEQRTKTFFQTRQHLDAKHRSRAVWQLRLGEQEPKSFAVLFDCHLGGRLSDVCEKYFAAGVEMLVDITKVQRSNFDPEKCLQVMPIRLAAPDAFIPGWGLMMDEFPDASYPFAHDSVWQTPALLAFEGLATGRDWEKNFARYFLDKTPLEGPDGKSYFVRRPGGLTRWGYFATYRDGFVPQDGGSWWQADILYRTALVLVNSKLRQAAVDMILHDLNVKLDLEKMSYPPCWSPTLNRVGDDHRDDWFMTPGLAYCAYMAARVAHPETGDSKYLKVADRIDEWFASFIVPENKLNYLQGNNMHAAFSHYLTLAFLEKYDRSKDRRFLDMARDMAWVHIMTTCTTAARDNAGHSLTGTTCVGVRGCVDYDCAPNLCQEKDLTFVHIIGPLLDHVSGPAYAKYIALCRLVLDKDSWESAWAMELRDTNLRTLYDTYARGMANLIYALNPCTDPWVSSVEKLVSKSDTNINHKRDLLVVNGTSQSRDSSVQIPYLQPGTYSLEIDGKMLGTRTSQRLAEGLDLNVPANSTRHVQVELLQTLDSQPPIAETFDSNITWLSDLVPFAAQRGTGLPKPVFRKNLSFDESPITIANQTFTNGLGCIANTVLVYELRREFDRFRATIGVDSCVAGKTNPPPSVYLRFSLMGICDLRADRCLRILLRRRWTSVSAMAKC